MKYGSAIEQAVSRRLFTVKSWARTQVSLCGIYSGQNGTGTGYSPSPFPVHNSTASPYSFMYHAWGRTQDPQEDAIPQRQSRNMIHANLDHLARKIQISLGSMFCT